MRFEINPDEFNIEFMKERGYIRKKCPKCGSYFWTNNFSRENCGETPCSKYSFLRNSPTRRGYSISEMRKLFLKFFEKNGHEIIDAYPVVARWRDDLLITIASIADFQPYVTAGLADPPANPLVISQPCLRFEDILNVGLTAGRHLTIFEMGGAHAFNRPDDGIMIYWKDDTIRLHHEFATYELGVPEESIVYKEHFWVGGGNAGPDVEGIINGLEVSTLVFMMYKITDSSLEKTPVLTVDTGYGVERWAWLSRGDPTAFHTIYGPLINWMMNQVNLYIEDEILYEDTINSPFYDISKPSLMTKLRNKLASKFDYDPHILNRKFSLFKDITILLDHIKAIIFLIKDGAVPSNVKEGYLTRMLLRKIFRIITLRELNDLLPQLISKEIDYWSRDFSDIRDMEDTIFEIIRLEEKKYKNILEKLPRIVNRYKRRYGVITDSDLIEIYDSQGIPPEIISDYLEKKEGVKLMIPSDFYEKVSRRHMKRETKVMPVSEIIVQHPTEKLYYIDSYWKSMVAKVINVDNNNLTLDKTIFYPEGGGQMSDQGIIRSGENKYNVHSVIESNGSIVHVLDKPLDKQFINQIIIGHINWERRYSLMRHHTATHILLGAIRRVLGGHVWQAGAEKRPEISRLDVTHYKLPKPDEVEEIERMANEVVSKEIPVEVKWMDRGLAEKEFGVRIYQGGMVPGKKIRVVKIGDWDVEACGGTHVLNTGELKYIKILSVEKIHDGVIRFNYVAGDRAIIESRIDHNITEKLIRILNVDRSSIVKSVESRLDEIRELGRKYMRLENNFIQLYAKELYDDSVRVNDIIRFIFITENDVERIVKIIEYMEDIYKDVVLIGVSRIGRGINVVIFIGKELREKGFNAYLIGEDILRERLKGGGKGDERYARFGGRFDGDLDALREVFLSYVKRRT